MGLEPSGEKKKRFICNIFVEIISLFPKKLMGSKTYLLKLMGWIEPLEPMLTVPL